jgi:hypothetical protein
LGVGSQNFSEFDVPREPKGNGYTAFFAGIEIGKCAVRILSKAVRLKAP